MKKLFVLGGCLLTTGLFALGCADTRVSRVESDFGTSAKLSIYNQIADPGAEKNLEPVEGLGAGPALNNYDKYEKSFQKAEERVDFSIRVGQ